MITLYGMRNCDMVKMARAWLDARMVAALLTVIISGPASAWAPPDPCGRRGDDTACYLAHEASFLNAFGLPTLESRRAAGDEVRRVMVFDRTRIPVVAIEFRRAPGQEPQVAIYRPASADVHGSAELAYAAPIPAEEWRRVSEAGAHFDRALAPPPPQPSRRGPTGEPAITICVDAWLDIVETSDPRAEEATRLRRRVEDTCQNGLANAYSDVLAAAAERLLPACRGIERPDDFPVGRLAACARLVGDRMAAAEAYNRVETLRDPRNAAELDDLFDYQARLDWMGEIVTDGRLAAEAWVRNTNAEPTANFFVSRVHGETAIRVRIEGTLQRWQRQGEDSALYYAPVEIILTLSPNDRRFHIEQATVAAYRLAPHFCDPDTLVLRCH